MGYALNLCKFHIYNVPYNHNIAEEGMEMTQNRVRIVDVADALGLSTATISNVIHGKTEKISDETVKRVQQELERSGYIPNMAGILLARNNSRIIGVVVNDHEKYEGRVLEDGFVMSSLNALSHEVNEKGYFLMIKTTSDIREIPVFASMWNMDGLILIGFCEADYESLRNQMRISFVVYDGYFEKSSKVVNLVIDHYDGGYQTGKYLKELGHKKALFLADNFICMDKERIEGFRKAFEQGETFPLNQKGYKTSSKGTPIRCFNSPAILCPDFLLNFFTFIFHRIKFCFLVWIKSIIRNCYRIKIRM